MLVFVSDVNIVFRKLCNDNNGQNDVCDYMHLVNRYIVMYSMKFSCKYVYIIISEPVSYVQKVHTKSLPNSKVYSGTVSKFIVKY